MSAPPSHPRKGEERREGEELSQGNQDTNSDMDIDDSDSNNDNNNNNNENNNNDDNNNDDNNNNGDDDGDAIDDTEDLPDDFVHLQKSISYERRREQSQQTRGIQDLLPFPYSPLIRPLTVSDLESCVALENAAFANPGHRCSRDKFIYRLTTCPELCMGVYCTAIPSNTKGWTIDTLPTAHPVETGRDDGAVSVLLAHIVATRSVEDVVTDEAMDYPRDYKTARYNNNSNDGGDGGGKSRLGHQEAGRTLCIHSLAVHPKLQGVGIGKLIVKAYMQQVKSSAVADRISLICEQYLITYYKRFGFTYVGPSKATYSGGGWHDMTFDLSGSSGTHC
ncbi:putative polyamine acetyltransferase [Rosellinia necatrix]|uniref:Putative polyamine acetyltransferase n=1 Tax=Rosellinia necatrix TaxID=77044 RepID=A0A1W2TB23_ROSNE|nr:putative polyamine acetyltransferase [Rosellinia necatrix]